MKTCCRRCWKTTIPFLAWITGRIAIMSVQSVSHSAPGRSFQSPFSHKDLFGRELPGCAASTASTKATEKLLACGSDTVIKKRKSKGSRSKKTSPSFKASHSSTGTSTTSKKIGKKKRTKVSSDSTDKVAGAKYSVSSRSTMAPVDSDRIVQSLPIRQPTVSKNSVDGSTLLRTQTIESEKTKTRYSKCPSEPPISPSSPPAETVASPTHSLSNPKIDYKILSKIQSTHQKAVGEKPEKDTRKMSMSKHLNHSSLSTSAYLRKFSTTHGVSSANSDHFASSTVTPSLSHAPTPTKAHSSTQTFSLSSLPHGKPVDTSKVNVRLHSKTPHHNLGARSLRTHSKRSHDGRNEPGSVEEVVEGLKRMQFHQVIVMSGAGISTASGIPDFRWVTARRLPLIFEHIRI